MIKRFCNFCNQEIKDIHFIEIKYQDFVFHYCKTCLIEIFSNECLTINFIFTFLDKDERNKLKRKLQDRKVYGV